MIPLNGNLLILTGDALFVLDKKGSWCSKDRGGWIQDMLLYTAT
jgi:hypothetical protein